MVFCECLGIKVTGRGGELSKLLAMSLVWERERLVGELKVRVYMRTDINRPHPLSTHMVSKNHYVHILIQISVLWYVDVVNIYIYIHTHTHTCVCVLFNKFTKMTSFWIRHKLCVHWFGWLYCFLVQHLSKKATVV